MSVAADPVPDAALRIKSVKARVYRYPLDTPVVTSFGEMRDRPMVLVTVSTEEGIEGRGEVWCNFPAVGAEHRARLVESMFAPLLVGQDFESPQAAFGHMTESTAVLAIQCAEPGPIAQCIAGIDTALWDIAGQAADQPLWKLLGGSSGDIGVYASGLNPSDPHERAAALAEDGYNAFKLKVGFGAERDLANLKALRDTIGADARLMVDANQGWRIGEAAQQIPKLAPFDLDWIEEPVRADSSWAQWRKLKSVAPAPLAGGENISGNDAFDEAIAEDIFGVIQPDLAKWGGISACVPLARRIMSAGVRYCPHYLGGGIGLLASAHVLAAVGGKGLLEIDANHNPLRSLLCGTLNEISGGRAVLPSSAGLGIEFDFGRLEPFRVH